MYARRIVFSQRQISVNALCAPCPKGIGSSPSDMVPPFDVVWDDPASFKRHFHKKRKTESCGFSRFVSLGGEVYLHFVLRCGRILCGGFGKYFGLGGFTGWDFCLLKTLHREVTQRESPLYINFTQKATKPKFGLRLLILKMSFNSFSVCCLG